DYASSTGVANETISFSLFGNSVGTATTNSSGVATLVVSANSTLAAKVVGTYSLQVGASFGGDASHSSSSSTADITVTKAGLTVPADAKSKVYGAADPTLTYTPSGTLYNGDAYTVITGVSLSTTTGAAATAGTHTITVSGATAANYSVTMVNGTLTVTAATLT